jgi:hypothetical protein
MTRSKRGSGGDVAVRGSASRSGGNSDWLTAGGSATGAGGLGADACFSVSSMLRCAERSFGG